MSSKKISPEVPITSEQIVTKLFLLLGDETETETDLKSATSANGSTKKFNKKQLIDGMNYGEFVCDNAKYLIGGFPKIAQFLSLLCSLHCEDPKNALIICLSQYYYGQDAGKENKSHTIPDIFYQTKHYYRDNEIEFVSAERKKSDLFDVVDFSLLFNGKPFNVKILECNFWPDHAAISNGMFATCVKIVHAMQVKCETNAIYFHCSMGIGRSVTTMLGLALYKRWLVGKITGNVFKELGDLIKSARKVRRGALEIQNVRMLIAFYEALRAHPKKN